MDSHIDLDLNELHFPERWPPMKTYDLIIAGEIIEHLFVTPQRIFDFLSTLLKPDGKILIQTPNSVSTRKRLKVLFGVNPYEQINEQRDGHVREFTAQELRLLCEQARLRCECIFFRDYWPERGILRIAERIVAPLRRGLTIVASLPKSGGTLNCDSVRGRNSLSVVKS